MTAVVYFIHIYETYLWKMIFTCMSKKFQMLFEQNIASNVTRNVGQLLGTYRNLLNLKKHEIFDFKKRLTEEERRTKQSLDSPQTIEANKK